MRTILPVQAGKGDWVEFGVGAGRSLKILRSLLPLRAHLWGFDSWKGLREPWLHHPSGHHKYPMPTLFRGDSRITLVSGYFEDTLPQWVEDRDQLSVIHFDCDLYSSTKTILESVNHLIRAGTILLFDEIYNFPGWETYEWKAFSEWRNSRGARTECLMRTSVNQAAFVVL